MRTATLATGLVLVACSWTYAQDVRTNYMPGIEFSKYHTYAWVNDVKGIPEVGGQIDQILDAQIKQAIDSQMATKGFTKAGPAEDPRMPWLRTPRSSPRTSRSTSSERAGAGTASVEPGSIGPGWGKSWSAARW